MWEHDRKEAAKENIGRPGFPEKKFSKSRKALS